MPATSKAERENGESFGNFFSLVFLNSNGESVEVVGTLTLLRPVPEPTGLATAALCLSMTGGLGLVRRFRRKRSGDRLCSA